MRRIHLGGLAVAMILVSAFQNCGTHAVDSMLAQSGIQSRTSASRSGTTTDNPMVALRSE